MAFGVQIDGSGLSVKSYREIREGIAGKMHEIFGESLDLSPSSPDGQLIDLFCYAYSDAAEALQGCYANLDVDSAEGVWLDNVGYIMGVNRDGRDDDTYRSALLKQSRRGLATLDAMRAYLSATVSPSVSVLDNAEPITNSDGIPGHSFRVVLPQYVYDQLEEMEQQGQIDDADDYVSQQIWNCKPAGISSDGNHHGSARDIVGVRHNVFFSITGIVDIEVKVILHLYQEEPFPQGGESLVQSAIREWATGTGIYKTPQFTPGKDVLVDRFKTPIMTVSGIASATVLVRRGSSGEWSSDDIEIGSQEIANLSSITVEVGS